jgi:hypothetical protein
VTGKGGGRTGHGLLVTGHWLLLTACNVTPLSNKIAIGDEPFVIAVGEGQDSLTDLFAAPAGGGTFARLTFNRAEERMPRLAPDGRSVAYLRRTANQVSWTLVVLDLLSDSERSSALPLGAGGPEGIGWSKDGRSVLLRAHGYYTMAREPRGAALVPVDTAHWAQADSATRELLGPGEQGVVRPCGAELCVVVGDSVTPLGPGVTGAMRWGPDSVGYFAEGWFEVRSLSGGYPRRPAWKAAPSRLRFITYNAGVRSPR